MTKLCHVQVANGAKTAPNVPNKGARRGAKCASAAHEGGAPLGFQPVHTPGQTRRSSRGVGDIPDTASSPRRHRYRGAHASPPLSQPPARYRPLDLNFSTLQCSTVLLYDLGTLYTVQLYIVLDQATVGSSMHDPPVYRQDLGAQQADKPRTKQITVEF